MAEYEDDFDPCEAFERFEVDEGAIHRRARAYEDEARRESARQAALEEERAEQRRASERAAAAAAAKREEYARLLPSRLAQIEEDERRQERPPPPHWPPLPGFRDLCMAKPEFDRCLAGLPSLPPAKDPCPERDEHGDDLGRLWQMTHFGDNLERLKPVFPVEPDHLVQDYHCGRMYQRMCRTLTSALLEGPYSVDYARLGCNMHNPHVRRLRAYFQNGEWGFYDVIDLTDGWTRLLQLMLAARPSYSGDDAHRLFDYFQAIRRVLERYREAVAQARESYIPSHRPANPTEYAINAAVYTLMDTMEIESPLYRLHRRLRAEEEALSAYIDSDPSLEGMARVREISQECMELRADTFVQHPDYQPVVLLRQIIFGRTPIPISAIKRDWPDYVLSLSGSYELYHYARAAAAEVCPRRYRGLW